MVRPSDQPLTQAGLRDAAGARCGFESGEPAGDEGL
jgi:hypothetical protein